MRFDDRIRGEIVGAIRIGVSHKRAALSAGVSDRQYRRWKKQAREDAAAGKDTAYSRFLGAIEKAESDALGQLEVNMWRQSEEDWRSAAWLLAKKDPEQYGKDIDAAVLDRLRQQIVREFFAFIQKHISATAFEEVCAALAGYGDEELDDRALPCPG